ncbi:MAG: hypothetical protein AAGF45_09285 [Pseudomonadota bacterium]
MTFSQGWDAGFKAVLIYIGIVFGWLIAIEEHLPDRDTSVIIMNVVGIAAGAAFFIYRRSVCRAQRAAAEAEIAALMQEDA